MRRQGAAARDVWMPKVFRRRRPTGGIAVTGWWEYRVTRGGKLLDEGGFHNLVTNVGLNAMKTRCFSSASGNLFDYIALGSGDAATVAGAAVLGTEWASAGLSRAQDASVNVAGTGIAIIDASWDCTSDSSSVREMGLFDAATSGNMFARVSTGDAAWSTAITLNDGDSLAVTVTITIADAGSTSFS